MMHAATAQDLIKRIGPDEQRSINVRFQYEVGIFASGALRYAVAYGGALGLDVALCPKGGILVRRGLITVSGPWPKVRMFLEAWSWLAEDQ